MIASSGKDLGELKTREQVRKQFGEPVASGTANGESFEEYHTHTKITDEVQATSHSMGFVMSYGVGELVAFPYQLFLLGRNTIIGQDIRFTYDSSGKVTRYSNMPPWRDPPSLEKSESSSDP